MAKRYLDWARIALRLERYDAAVYLLQRACERLPHMLEPLHALADAFNGVHSPQDALTVPNMLNQLPAITLSHITILLSII